MRKIASLFLSSALLVGCSTALDQYRKDTGHTKPNTVASYNHFGDWCKRTGRDEDRIWAYKHAFKKAKRGSKEELDAQVSLSESYLTHLKSLQLELSSNLYASNKNEIMNKGKFVCLEAMEVINSVPRNEIRLYGVREEILYLCDKFDKNYSFSDFHEF